MSTPKGTSGKEAFEVFASAVEQVLRDYGEDYIKWIFEPDKKDEGLPTSTSPAPATIAGDETS